MKTIELLKTIWTKDIAKDFKKGTLVNERTLQAAIYHHVRNRGLRLGLGVRLEVQSFNLGLGIPDMVIVKAKGEKRIVEAVIDLKLLPSNKGIVYQGDIRKLVGWAQAVHADPDLDDRFDVDPKTLDWTGGRYKFTTETSWIFAAIGADDCAGLDHRIVGDYARKHTSKKGADISQLNLWLFPGMLSGRFGPMDKL